MCSVNTILFHEILLVAGRNPGKNIVPVAVDAIATAKDLGEELSPKSLEKLIARVFGHIERFPCDPAWVASEAFKKYRLDFGYTEV